MYSPRWIVQCFTLVLFSTQPIFSKIIRFEDGGVTYEYDNSIKPLGTGHSSRVYKGVRIEGNRTESVAFKEFQGEITEAGTEYILNEKKMLNAINALRQNDSFPKLYYHSPETSEAKGFFVLELVGKSLRDLWNEFGSISPITAMQIGIQMLDALECMYEDGITHNDMALQNTAVGYHNKSKIYLIDFGCALINETRTFYRRNKDFYDISSILNLMIRPNQFDNMAIVRNNALKEFNDFLDNHKRNISDDEFRAETFGKLRSILMTELESHKNDADYHKYLDIASIQDSGDRMNLLQKLIKQNDTIAIEQLIASDHELNINAGFGNCSYYKPIHLAAELGKTHVVQSLLEHGAEIDIKYNETHYETSPLHYATKHGYADMTRILVEYNAEINAKGPDGRTPLHYAAQYGDVDTVRFLIEHHAEINASNFDGKTPLHCAADNGHAKVSRILIESGADVNAVDNDGNTPLFYAAQNGHAVVIEMLIECGVEYNVKFPNGDSMLHYAARFGNLKLVVKLIENGADISYKGNRGETPLTYAANFGHTDVARILIEHGADISVENETGNTPLHCAARSGNVNLVRMLIDHGAEICARDVEGLTPLHYAAMWGRVDVVEFLIETGAEITAKQNDGRTPLDWATMNDNTEIVKILREAEQKLAISMESDA